MSATAAYLTQRCTGLKRADSADRWRARGTMPPCSPAVLLEEDELSLVEVP